MPRGDKSKYTDKQERKAEHIAEGYEKKGVSTKEAEGRRLGDGQQGRWRRQEDRRVRARQDDRPSGRQERGQKGRGGFSRAAGGGPQEIREEGRCDAQAPRT